MGSVICGRLKFGMEVPERRGSTQVAVICPTGAHR